jgi:hypothetical protein
MSISGILGIIDSLWPMPCIADHTGRLEANAVSPDGTLMGSNTVITAIQKNLEVDDVWARIITNDLNSGNNRGPVSAARHNVVNDSRNAGFHT